MQQPVEPAPRLITAGALKDTGAVVWSLWDGYLDDPGGLRLQATLAAAGVELIQHHTSGHASEADLARLIAAIAPHRVVPIHTEHPEACPAGNLDRHPDGQWWAVHTDQ